MRGYWNLKHREEVPREFQGDTSGEAYGIAYLSVIQREATSTEIWNVFNASSPTPNGVNLSQMIHPEPKLTNRIFDILFRMRRFKSAYSSDITKIYRQILLKPEGQLKLKILWRQSPEVPLKEYFLKTLAYGWFGWPSANSIR